MNEKVSVAVGDVVFMKNKGLKRNAWLLARVSDVKRSSDGLVRSVTLIVPSRSSKNKMCTLFRPINEIIMINKYKT